MLRSIIAAGFGCLIPLAASAADVGNRLTYLDEYADPYYVGLQTPKLITPQWVGEDGVEAVVVLSIDDMSDAARYEASCGRSGSIETDRRPGVAEHHDKSIDPNCRNCRPGCRKG